eukprot:TRINITY_DN2855_c1_g1_i1.p1 TRINITY_DN2855_c1_g1~~TRINITY_DN2855_c1_g1_i1.p1  ORF type:complete len:189 (-),score=28.70 TRINITY_DN2855_c1_g1_i1:228-794(-)
MSFPVLDEDPEEFFTPENNRISPDHNQVIGSEEIDSNDDLQKRGLVLNFDEFPDENDLDSEIQHLSLDLDIVSKTSQEEMLSSEWLTHHKTLPDNLQQSRGVDSTCSNSSKKSKSKLSVFSHPLPDLRQSWNSEDTTTQVSNLQDDNQEQLSPISKMLQEEVQSYQKEQNWLLQASSCDEQEWSHPEA